MLLNKDALQLDGVPNISSYLTEVEYGYNKLWAGDSGRSLSGKKSGTLIGIFPKLRFTFRKLTQQELETLADVIDEAEQFVTYYDPKLKRMYRMSTYTGDWATSNKTTFSDNAKANSSFQLSFIANDKRPRK